MNGAILFLPFHAFMAWTRAIIILLYEYIIHKIAGHYKVDSKNCVPVCFISQTYLRSTRSIYLELLFICEDF